MNAYTKEVLEKDELLPKYVVKILVSALCLFRRRYKDVFMREYVEVTVGRRENLRGRSR